MIDQETPPFPEKKSWHGGDLGKMARSLPAESLGELLSKKLFSKK